MKDLEVAIIRKSYPIERFHECDLPGFWRRWRLGLKEGAIIQCDHCASYYIWNLTGGWAESWQEWSRCDAQGRV